MCSPSPKTVLTESSNLVGRLQAFARLSGLFVFLIGISALVGWMLNIPVLKSALVGGITLKPNTALGLLLNGLVLYCWRPMGGIWHKQWLRSMLRLLPALVLLLGMLTLAEYGFNWNLGLDDLLFEADPNALDAAIGGRPAPNTALSFVLTGLALLLLQRHCYRPAQGLGLLSLLVALVALTGHLYAITDFYQVGTVTGMSLNTAIAFVLLSIGILLVRVDQGWGRNLCDSRAGGQMMRRLLPWTVMLPIVTGLVLLRLYNRIAPPPEVVFALRTVISIIMLSAIVIWQGRALNHLDSQRRAVLEQINHQLEAQVAARTAELSESRDQLQLQLSEIEAIYRSAPIGLNVIDSDLRFVRINERLAEMNGLSVEAHLGQTIAELLPDLAEAAEQLLRPVFETGEPLLDVEITGETPAKPGVQRIWQESFLPLKQDGRVVGISTVCEEITEQKRTQTALSERAKQQAEIAQLGLQALASGNLKTLLQLVTERVAQTLNVEYCKVLKLLPEGNKLQLIAGVGWQPHQVGQAIVGTEQTSQAGYTLIVDEPVVVEDLRTETRFSGPSLLTAHGVVSGISIVIEGTGDHPFGILGMHTCSRRAFSQNDVSFLQAVANILSEAVARYQSEQIVAQLNLDLERRVEERTQQLMETNQELDAFAYTVSHDLRAPLRAIEGFARIFLEDYGLQLDKTGQTYANRLVDAAMRLDSLILDLLEYSRLGRCKIHLTPIELSDVIKVVLQDLAVEFADRAPQITVEPLPTVLGQRSILHQMLTNLLTNAVKFVPSHRQINIDIWAEERGPNIRLWIRDNGIGIAEQHQDRIFQPFERLHGIEHYPGTGIGLAIVQRGTERMGGEVGVESNVGVGSQFWIELAQPPAEQANSSQANSSIETI